MAITQIRNEQIFDLEITNAKIATAAGILTTKLADGANFIQKDGSVDFTSDQSMGSNKLTNLAAPSADNDAARKIDIDNASGTIITREVPSGSINGVNTTFTLANTPLSGSESLYLNGNLLQEGASNDYTISGATITMNVAPSTGDLLLASYFISGILLSSVQTNDSFLKWRNAADSADIDVLKVDSNDDTVLNADTGDQILLQIGGSDAWVVDSSSNLIPASNYTYTIGNSSQPRLVKEVWAAELKSVNINLAIGTKSGHDMLIVTNDTDRWRFAGGGNLLVEDDSSYDIATTSVRVANVYADAFPAFSGIHLYVVNGTNTPEAGEAVKLNTSSELVPCDSAEDAACIGILTGAYAETTASNPTVRDSKGNIYTRETDPVVEKRVYHVVSLGDAYVGSIQGAKVCDEGGSVSDGDLLCTANKDGFLKKQSDDIVRAKTVAQARETVSFDGNGEATGVYVYLLK